MVDATRTVDLTPTWEGILPALITIIENSDSVGRKHAVEELQRMARLADQYVAAIKEGKV